MRLFRSKRTLKTIDSNIDEAKNTLKQLSGINNAYEVIESDDSSIWRMIPYKNKKDLTGTLKLIDQTVQDCEFSGVEIRYKLNENTGEYYVNFHIQTRVDLREGPNKKLKIKHVKCGSSFNEDDYSTSE